MIPEYLMHDGQRKRVVYWEASWSLNLRFAPHVLWIVWEGAGKKAERFTSDASGVFAELDIVPEPEGIASGGWFRRGRRNASA